MSNKLFVANTQRGKRRAARYADCLRPRVLRWRRLRAPCQWRKQRAVGGAHRRLSLRNAALELSERRCQLDDAQARNCSTLLSIEFIYACCRWMSEAILFTICFKPAIEVDELCSLYSYILQPVCVRELLEFLAILGCVNVNAEAHSSLKKSSPFCGSFRNFQQVCAHLIYSAYAFRRTDRGYQQVCYANIRRAATIRQVFPRRRLY